MHFALSDALIAQGTNFKGAGDSASVNEPLCSIDFVRRAAVVGSKEGLEGKPPLLLTDGMKESELYLYDNYSGDSVFAKGPPKTDLVGLHVVGGAIYESTRCKFPVSILCSEGSKAIVINSCGTPFAKLELEFYDHPYAENISWSKLVMDSSEIACHLQQHKLAARGVRTTGFHRIPNFLLGVEEYSLVKTGVTAFMCLRAPENEEEHTSVLNCIQSDLRVFPVGSKKIMQGVTNAANVRLLFRGSTSLSMTVPREINPPPACERHANAQGLASYAVLTFIANVLLKNAVEHGFGDQEQDALGCNSGIRHRVEHGEVIASVEATEASFVLTSKTKKVTSLNPTLTEKATCTLADVFRDTGRTYATKLLCQKSDATGVLSAVAREIFHESDAKAVHEKCISLVAPRTPPSVALHELATVMEDKNALVIITRRHDGVLANVQLVAHKAKILEVNVDALVRLLSYTWTQFVIVDNESISVLLTRDPEFVCKSESFEREKFRMRQSEKSELVSGDLSKKVDMTLHQAKEVASELRGLRTEVNNLKKLVHFMVDEKSKDDDDLQDRRHIETITEAVVSYLRDRRFDVSDMKGTADHVVAQGASADCCLPSRSPDRSQARSATKIKLSSSIKDAQEVLEKLVDFQERASKRARPS